MYKELKSIMPYIMLIFASINICQIHIIEQNNIISKRGVIKSFRKLTIKANTISNSQEIYKTIT